MSATGPAPARQVAHHQPPGVAGHGGCGEVGDLVVGDGDPFLEPLGEASQAGAEDQPHHRAVLGAPARSRPARSPGACAARRSGSCVLGPSSRRTSGAGDAGPVPIRKAARRRAATASGGSSGLSPTCIADERLARAPPGRPPSSTPRARRPGRPRSSTRDRPAPSAMAARPTASASMASTTPVAGAATSTTRGRARQPVGLVDGPRDRRPAPRRSAPSLPSPRPSAMACSTSAARLGAGRPPRRPRSSISAPSTTVSSRRSAGPPPRRSSIDLRHLERVADGAAERLVHVGEQRRDPLAHAAADADQRARPAPARRSCVFMKAPPPTLTSSTSAVDPLGQLLRHDRGGDERDRLDGGGDVAQRVELAGRPGRCASVWPIRPSADRRATSATNRSTGRSTRKPGIDSSLSSVPPVWPRPRPRDHRHRDAAGRDQRRQRQRDLVAHAAGRVLVDLGAGDVGEVEHVAGVEHGLGRGPRARPRSCRGRRPPCRRRPSGSRARSPRRSRSRAPRSPPAATGRPSRLRWMTS